MLREETPCRIRQEKKGSNGKNIQHAVTTTDSKMNRQIVSHFVYPSETLVTPMDQRNFYARIFRPAVIATKLEDGVGWHTLRHTFASRLAMSGQTEGTLQPSCGIARRRLCDGMRTYLHPICMLLVRQWRPTASPQ